MATRIKMEVFFTVSENDVTLEADRLVEHMRLYKPRIVLGGVFNGGGPFYDRCEVSQEKKTWESVA